MSVNNNDSRNGTKKYKVQIIDTTPIPNSYREEINDKISPIDKEDANAEIERGEIVFNPETMLLQKANGNKHSKGGTPVNLDKNSFIFSDYKKLGFNKDDIKEMEFKKGGTYKPKNNTPSKVLEREIDLKHHNNMVNILKNENTNDDITKKSAALMLMKNTEKIGQIGYKQEQKKQFPQGTPQISEGTAPVYTQDLNTEIDQSKQYKPIKYNPYLDKYKEGGFLKQFTDGRIGDTSPLFGNIPLNCPCGRDPQTQQCLPCPDGDPRLKSFMNNAPLVQTPPAGYNPIGKIGNTTTYSNSVAGKMGGKDFNTAFGNAVKAKLPTFTYNGKLYNTKKASDSFVKTTNDTVLHPNIIEGLKPTYRQPVDLPTHINPLSINTTMGEQPANITGPSVPTTYNVGFTPWQQINAAIPFIRAANVKTYMPLRQHQESVTPQLEGVNDQAYINNANQSYFKASQLNRLQSNPSLAIAGNEEMRGNILDNIDKITGDVLNQNTQIQNNQKVQTANTLNGDAGANRQFDSRYYDQVNTSLQNRDDLKTMLNNQGLTNLNQMVSENQAFNSQLNSQQQYKTDEVVGKDSDGNPIYRSRALYEPTKNFFGYNTRYTPNLNINFKDLPGSDNKNLFTDGIQQSISKLIQSGDYKSAAELMKSYAQIGKLQAFNNYTAQKRN